MTRERKSHSFSRSLFWRSRQFVLSVDVPLVCMLTPILLLFSSFRVCNKVMRPVHPHKKCTHCQFVRVSPCDCCSAWKRTSNLLLLSLLSFRLVSSSHLCNLERTITGPSLRTIIIWWGDSALHSAPTSSGAQRASGDSTLCSHCSISVTVRW